MSSASSAPRSASISFINPCMARVVLLRRRGESGGRLVVVIVPNVVRVSVVVVEAVDVVAPHPVLVPGHARDAFLVLLVLAPNSSDSFPSPLRPRPRWTLRVDEPSRQTPRCPGPSRRGVGEVILTSRPP